MQENVAFSSLPLTPLHFRTLIIILHGADASLNVCTGTKDIISYTLPYILHFFALYDISHPAQLSHLTLQGTTYPTRP